VSGADRRSGSLLWDHPPPPAKSSGGPLRAIFTTHVTMLMYSSTSWVARGRARVRCLRSAFTPSIAMHGLFRGRLRQWRCLACLNAAKRPPMSDFDICPARLIMSPLPDGAHMSRATINSSASLHMHYSLGSQAGAARRWPQRLFPRGQRAWNLPYSVYVRTCPFFPVCSNTLGACGTAATTTQSATSASAAARSPRLATGGHHLGAPSPHASTSPALRALT
jgi:hypothetical protein